MLNATGRRPSSCLIVLGLATACLIVAFGSAALAQGSAGGSIGKQGKSASGSEDAPKPRSTRPRERPARERARPAPRRTQEAARPRRSEEPRAAPAASGSGIAGAWRWSATCEKGARNYTGVVTFKQSGNTFTGSHGGTNIWDTGRISDGRIEGSHVTFARIWGAYVDHMSLTMSGGRMSGTLPFSDHSGRCEMSFVRN